MTAGQADLRSTAPSAPPAQLRGQRLVVHRGPKHAHSMPQHAIRRRFSSTLIRPTTSNSATARPATLPTASSTDLTSTMEVVIGRRPVAWPDQSTHILTLVPAGTPILAGTGPTLCAPEGACQRPVTQLVASDPYPLTCLRAGRNSTAST